jgi:hypothetical protein
MRGLPQLADVASNAQGAIKRDVASHLGVDPDFILYDVFGQRMRPRFTSL